jgi:hypothetical protein
VPTYPGYDHCIWKEIVDAAKIFGTTVAPILQPISARIVIEVITMLVVPVLYCCVREHKLKRLKNHGA